MPATTLLSFLSNYWEFFALAATYFKYCFSFFNCLFFSQKSTLSLFLLLFEAIAFLISFSSPQSAPVYSSQSFSSDLYLMLIRYTSKSLVGLICMPIIRKIEVAIFEVLLASFCSNSFSKLLVVW